MAEKKMQKKCGHCRSFVPMGSLEVGTCRVMPGKSFRGKKVMADMDASDCPKFEAVEAVFDISTIGTAQFAQGAFPIPSSSDIESLVGRFGVARGEQIGEIPEDLAPSKEKEDRLIWEKHEKEQESKKEE